MAQLIQERKLPALGTNKGGEQNGGRGVGIDHRIGQGRKYSSPQRLALKLQYPCPGQSASNVHIQCQEQRHRLTGEVAQDMVHVGHMLSAQSSLPAQPTFSTTPARLSPSLPAAPASTEVPALPSLAQVTKSGLKPSEHCLGSLVLSRKKQVGE